MGRLFSFTKPRAWLALSKLMIFGGGLLAWAVQTNFGGVKVQDIRFQDDSGDTLSALLYVPDTASTAAPAPGVLAVHGYINSRETQSAYAIELARRGYVVLALDQRGHGYSDPPAFAEGFGGPAGLRYLRGLTMVNPDQILLSGHSMGGWTVLSAAAAMPQDYAAVVVSGSSTGTFGVPPGDSVFPRNFALVEGTMDEFSATMWQSPTGAGVVDTDKLKAQFGTGQRVEAGRLYGDLGLGTARMLYQPTQTHPANHITATGVAPVLEWAQLTVPPVTVLDPQDQIWGWKEFGTSLSLLGAFLFLLVAGPVLLEFRRFASLRQAPAVAAGLSGSGWWLGAAIFVAVPALSYFPFQGFAARIPANAWLGQNLTTGFMVWALGNTLISLLLMMLWFFLLGGRKRGASAASLGLILRSGFSLQQLGRTALLSLGVVGSLYLVLAVNHFLFTADFRFWVVAVKLMGQVHFHEFLVYLLPFTLFFVVTGTVLHGQLRGAAGMAARDTLWRNAVLAGLGILLLLLYQYLPLLNGGTLAIPAQALLTIVALQFVVLLPVTALVSTWYFRLTGTVYAGAMVNGLFLTWLIVAGQATHFAY